VPHTSAAFVIDSQKPRSGTGELAGISGVGLITIADDGAHTLHLDYQLE
jgi:Protein of unknown function (DUF3224)